MRVVYEYDFQQFVDFLKTHGIDHPTETLIPLAIQKDGETVGYVWFSWVDEATLEFHLNVPTRGWTHKAMGDVLKFAEIMGATRLISKDLTPPALRLARRMNWTINDDWVETTLPSEWSRYGRVFRSR